MQRPFQVAAKFQVEAFLDYREYLLRIYSELKTNDRSYSYLKYAQDLGFGATNVLRLFIAGKRLMTQESALKIVQALRLQGNQRQFFLALAALAYAKTQKLREERLAELSRLKLLAIDQEKDLSLVQYFSDWAHPIIRELSRLPSAPSSPPEIRARLYPEIRVRRIENAIEFLQKENFLMQNKSGRLVLSDERSLELPAEAAAGELSLLKFHDEMMQISRECLSKVPADEREYNSLTLCLSSSAFAALKEKIRLFCEEALAMDAREKNLENVVQLNIQMFQITKSSKPLKKGEP